MRRTVLDAAQESESAIDLTPMLDVVFIMLIFFIVTASFIKEAGIEVTRPEALTAERKPNASILIAISPGNEVWIDRKKVQPNGVRTAIEKLLAENPEGQVVVQADKDSYAETLLLVMDAARAAGVANVAISAEED